MKIKTYCKTIELNFYDEIFFDYEQSKISFTLEAYKEDIYFESANWAKEFYQEILEALYSNAEEIDLSHFIVVYGSLNIRDTISEINDRIKNN